MNRCDQMVHSYCIIHFIIFKSTNIQVKIVCTVYSGTPLVRPPPFAPEKWPFKRGGLPSGVETIHLCLDLQSIVAFPEGLVSHQGGLSKGVPLYRYVHMRDF